MTVPNKTHYPPHPLAAAYPPKSPEEMQELKDSFVERVNLKLHPQEEAILLLKEQILDGIHRSQAWMELADEGACEGYFKQNQPKFEVCECEDTLSAWHRVKSRNLIHRQLSADQRAAVFFRQMRLCPELKQAIEEIQSKNKQRQVDGKPLDAGAQRGNTSKEIANLAAVGETTMKKIERISRELPKELANIASGVTSANKVVQLLNERENEKKKKQQRSKGQTPATQSSTNAEATENTSEVPAMFYLSIVAEVASDVAEIRRVLHEQGITLKEKKNATTTVFEGQITMDLRQEALVQIGQLSLPILKIVIPAK